LKELLPLDESVLVFLHIKKTGGISLQRLIQDRYPGKFYGNDHSALKRKIRVKKSEIEDIPNGSAVANHWTYDDFAHIKDRCNFVTIVRNPIDRIISAYNFYKKYSEEGNSFSSYINNNKNINIIIKTIKHLRNITEIYSLDSIKKDLNESSIFNSNDFLHTNRTTYSEIKGVYSYYPNRKETKEFTDLNEEDINFCNGIFFKC